MKILLSSVYHISSSKGGGNEQYLHQLALGLITRGVQINYLTAEANNLSNYPYKIDVLPLKHLFNKPLLSPSWNNLISKKKFDLFHASGSGLALSNTAGFIKNRLKKSTILTYQADSHPKNLILKLASLYEHYLMSKVFDQIITTTPYYQKKLTNKWPDKKICFIPMMLPGHIRKIKINKKTLKKQLKLPLGKKLILFVGKLSSHQYYKGIDNLIQASQKLRSDYQIIIIGNGDKKTYYQNLVLEKKLDYIVKFTGSVSNQDLNKYYQACDIFVLPSNSNSEGFGLVLIEAMFHKLPIITTSVIGSANWLKQEKVANLIKPDDVGILSKEIKKILNQNNKTMIERAYRFSKQFKISRTIDQQIKVYQQLLS